MGQKENKDKVLLNLTKYLQSNKVKQTPNGGGVHISHIHFRFIEADLKEEKYFAIILWNLAKVHSYRFFTHVPEGAL